MPLLWLAINIGAVLLFKINRHCHLDKQPGEFLKLTLHLVHRPSVAWLSGIPRNQVLEVLNVLSTDSHALSEDLGTLPNETTRDGLKIREIFTRKSVDGQVRCASK